MNFPCVDLICAFPYPILLSFLHLGIFLFEQILPQMKLSVFLWTYEEKGLDIMKWFLIRKQ